MILTTYDRGMAAREAKGERKALREVIVQLASPRCGAPGDAVLASLQRRSKTSPLA